jgi:hypothetical protein
MYFYRLIQTTQDSYKYSFFPRFLVIQFNFCVADVVMLLTCFFHFKSICIVTSIYFVDVSFCSTCYTSLSPIRRGFAPGFVNYNKGALNSLPQVIKFTSCLPMVGGSLRVLRLLPPLKLVVMITVLVIGLYELLGNPTT